MILFAVSVGLVVVGCGPSSSPASDSSVPGDRTYASLAPGDAVVRVNGKDLTKQDIEDLLVLRNFIYRLRTGEDTSAPLPPDEICRAFPMLMQEMIHHELFRQYAEERGIVPSAAAVRAAETNMLAALKKSPATGLSALTGGISPGAARIFMSIPYQDARDHLLRQSVTTNDLNGVTEAELKAREAFVKEFDANADRLNAAQAEKLMKVRERILAGELTFERAAAETSEVSPEDGRTWATYELDELPDDEDLHKWLCGARVGEISKPLDLPDGLALVKLVSKQKGEAPPGGVPPDTYTLVKCTLHAFERMRYQDRAQMTRQLLQWKREEAQQKLGTMLVGRAVIEFPNGTNFFPIIQREVE